MTHGLAYLPRMDYIYVLKDGRILESGTYTYLLKQNRDFAEFLRTYATNDQTEPKYEGMP